MTKFSMRRTPKPRTKWTLYLILFSVSFMQQVQADCASHLKGDVDGVAMEWEDQCYIYVSVMLTCEEMFNSCEGGGGVAAKIVSFEQQSYFFRKVVDTIYSGHAYLLGYFWIGLKYDQNIGDWKWANGDPVTWTNWKTRPKESSCLAVENLEGTWIEHDASQWGDGHICHMGESTKKSPPITIATTVKTTTALVTTTATSASTYTSSDATTPIHETTGTTTRESTTMETRELNLQHPPPAKKRPQVTQRGTIFEAFRDKGEHPYLSEKPNAVVKTSSLLVCCSECRLLLGCSVANFNFSEKLCRLFVNREVLHRVEQNPGWMVFVIDLID